MWMHGCLCIEQQQLRGRRKRQLRGSHMRERLPESHWDKCHIIPITNACSASALLPSSPTGAPILPNQDTPGSPQVPSWDLSGGLRAWAGKGTSQVTNSPMGQPCMLGGLVGKPAPPLMPSPTLGPTKDDASRPMGQVASLSIHPRPHNAHPSLHAGGKQP